MMRTKKLINENKGTVVYVRTAPEYIGGHVDGSVNILLQEIKLRIEDIPQPSGPLILCCACGNRSEMATKILSPQGLDFVNGGFWMEVNYLQSKYLKC